MITINEAIEIRNEIIAYEKAERAKRVKDFCDTVVDHEIREAVNQKRVDRLIRIPAQMITYKNEIIEYIVQNGGFKANSKSSDIIEIKWG